MVAGLPGDIKPPELEALSPLTTTPGAPSVTRESLIHREEDTSRAQRHQRAAGAHRSCAEHAGPSCGQLCKSCIGLHGHVQWPMHDLHSWPHEGPACSAQERWAPAARWCLCARDVSSSLWMSDSLVTDGAPGVVVSGERASSSGGLMSPGRPATILELSVEDLSREPVGRYADHMPDPADMFLYKEHFNSGCVGQIMDFHIGHPGLPGYTKDPLKAADVEILYGLYVPLVGGPGFLAIQQC
ncbi:hypothetical protein SKAU_G00066300 [Synaphobranchus kaupii]|uniref:Uncharacterized protein n=1 Tax=Synaphobranchus kaupii TaxID=118154 RepID=A0A9Q1JB99_SYNKA|nr:hypothetical protein SKAU_G00066300 [Synaphobranchus kaupii]